MGSLNWSLCECKSRPLTLQYHFCRSDNSNRLRGVPMFRFTIRELLLLTVIVAVGVAWGIDRTRLAGERDAAGRAATEYVSQVVALRSVLRSSLGIDVSFDENGRTYVKGVDK